MGLSKIALNLAERTASYAKMLGKSSILETKPISRVNVSGLKYSANLKADTFSPKIDKWVDGIKTTPPYVNTETTAVIGHHRFHGGNSLNNTTIESFYKQIERNFAGRPEDIIKMKSEGLAFLTENNIRSLKRNRDFLKLQPQPHQSTVFRARSRNCDGGGADFEIISKAKVGDEIIPSGGFAYAAHFKPQTAPYLGLPDGMLYEIVVPKGSQISVNMEHGGETVFPALSKFKLLKKETRYIKCIQDEVSKVSNAKAYPYTYVKMEYVPEIPALGKEFENISNAEIKTLVQKAKECNCTTWADFAELPKKLGS